MATMADRVRNLETGVERLETWAGPGQIEALIDGQRDLRTHMGELRGQIGELRGHMGELRGQIGELRGQMGELRGQMGDLRADVTGLKDMLQEVLRRLPPAN
ncbi:MAG TPA: hypothetical protein VIV12_21780 [Streptosporangiaceae bacterium]